MSIEGIYGIDLGTTNSCIALVSQGSGNPEVKQNFEGYFTTPSVVYFEEDNPSPIVGLEAKRWARAKPSLVCSQVKRHMGEDEWRFEVQDKEYRAEGISAYVLKKVLGDALQYDGHKWEGKVQAVVSVPAYFGAAERKATRLAGEIAGIEVMDLPAEPVAAAFAYGFGRVDSEQNLLVYDLGGGTFDATIVRVDGSSAHTVATDGVRVLGGMDWDAAIVDWVRGKFEEEHGVELPSDEEDLALSQTLYEEAEQAKHSLSQRQSTVITVHYEGNSSSLEITLEEFEQITKPLMDRTIEKTAAVIEAARNKGVDRIDQLLLVGGSSRMKIVKTRLEQELGLEANLHDPDQAIAKGAALIGELIRQGQYKVDTSGDKGASADTEGRIVSMVNSRSLGLVVYSSTQNKDFVDYLIPRNSELPVSNTNTYGIHEDNQQKAELIVMEQREEESQDPDQNTMLHEAPIDLPPGLQKGSKIQITFTLDGEGILHINVFEPISQKTWEVDVDREGKISDEEILKLKAEMA